MKLLLKLILAAAILMLAAGTASARTVRSFSDFPEGTEPEVIGRRITEQFLSADPFSYAPAGFSDSKPHGWRRDLTYAIVSLWTNCLEFSHNAGYAYLEKTLTDNFEPYYSKKKRNGDNHVDHSIFGALPLEIFLLTGDRKALDYGLYYADHQWSEPDPKHPGGTGNKTYEEQLEFLARGYTPQTRLWIDDMYMINFLQTQAFRATGEQVYLDRSAKEMVLYLDSLQNDNGMFYHSATAHFDWGRGNGWMAAGMAIVLKYLPEAHKDYKRIMKGYRAMMKTLLKNQRESGLWGQLVTDQESWDETSGSAMFTYAFVEGVRNGWLPMKYGRAARKAWIALCGKLDSHANIADVCIGTNEFNDRNYYLERARINGDPHGQAAMMWIANALLN